MLVDLKWIDFDKTIAKILAEDPETNIESYNY